MDGSDFAAESAIPWVDAENGLVSREIFVSESVYQKELDKIFRKVWLYLGHETEIPNPGDVITRTLAAEPVMIVRCDDGQINAFLNSCRHRGVRLCRVDSGSVKRFVCPYHGWTYDRTGRLVSTTLDSLYPDGTDFSQLGLVKVPKVASYKGLIFGSWNDAVMSLDEYLGEFRWYIDLFFARTPQGSEVLGPPQRSLVNADWKVAAINFGTDTTHVQTTHIGPLTLGKTAISSGDRANAHKAGVQVSARNGHSVSLLGFPGDPYRYYPEELRPLFQQALSSDQQSILRDATVAIGTIFPNLSFIENPPNETAPGEYTKSVMLRLWQPLGPGRMEIISWCLAEREASQKYKEISLSRSINEFGIAGLFEQEDVELWSTIAASSAGPNAQRHPLVFKTALPFLNSSQKDHVGPAEAYQPFSSEVAQFKFLLNWHRLMTGETA